MLEKPKCLCPEIGKARSAKPGHFPKFIDGENFRIHEKSLSSRGIPRKEEIKENIPA
jgi:hypothetical protein